MSAATGFGLEELMARIEADLPGDALVKLRLRIPAEDGATMHRVHEETRILTRRFDEDAYEIEAEMTEAVARGLAGFAVP